MLHAQVVPTLLGLLVKRPRSLQNTLLQATNKLVSVDESLTGIGDVSSDGGGIPPTAPSGELASGEDLLNDYDVSRNKEYSFHRVATPPLDCRTTLQRPLATSTPWQRPRRLATEPGARSSSESQTRLGAKGRLILPAKGR